jgi:hypothetical protein
VSGSETNVSGNANVTPGSPSLADIFAPGFQDMYYAILSNREDFDLVAFRANFGAHIASLDSYSVSAAPSDGLDGQYHVHFSWLVEQATLDFRVEYYKGPIPRAHDEREPFAEQFMEWLGKFFSSESVACHIHTRFEYPLNTRRSLYPLPQVTTLPYHAAIHGISLQIKDEPRGASSVRLNQGKSFWYADVVANRTISFKGFSPKADVTALSDVLAEFLGEASDE